MHTSDVQQIFDNAPLFILVQPSILASVVKVVVVLPYIQLNPSIAVPEMIPLFTVVSSGYHKHGRWSLSTRRTVRGIGSYEAGNWEHARQSGEG